MLPVSQNDPLARQVIGPRASLIGQLVGIEEISLEELDDLPLARCSDALRSFSRLDWISLLESSLRLRYLRSRFSNFLVMSPSLRRRPAPVSRSVEDALPACRRWAAGRVSGWREIERERLRGWVAVSARGVRSSSSISMGSG